MAAAAALAVVAAVACVPAARAGEPVLREDLAVYHRAVSTESKEAQRWFDQGLVLSFGFHHQAAIASFRRAGELDPGLAMAAWGEAFAAGPHINNPQMDEAASKLAYEAAQRAVALADERATPPVEQALIRAVAARYAWPPPADRSALDRAFADAMREAFRAHPDDVDVAAIFAEAMMDLRPWDLWSTDGEPRPETRRSWPCSSASSLACPTTRSRPTSTSTRSRRRRTR
jgi:hypothetical protein